MIGLIQRVKHAQVVVDERCVGKINEGILLFFAVEKNDNETCAIKLAKKVANLRIFEDEDHKMNKSLLDINAEILVVSQFTLAADTQKGNRPGFSNAAGQSSSKHLYDFFIAHMNQHYTQCQTGEFGANMQVSLLNDGPATFTINC